MYKLMIVDDEATIRQGIAESIPWNEWGFVVSGQAANGMEALRLIGEEKPDVVLSDIRMPKMDGVQLMQHLHQNYPEIKIIILSGYNDIEYLNMSIKSRVTEYLLKPTNMEDFRVLFARLRNTLDQERTQKHEFERLLKFYEDNQLQHHVRFLSRLIKGEFSDRAEVSKQLTACGFEPAGFCCSVVSIEIDNLQQKTGAHSQGAAEALRAEVCSLCGKQDGAFFHSFFLNGSGELIGILRPSVSGKEDTAALLTFLNEIQEQVRRRMGLSISIGMSDWCRDEMALPQFYRQAKTCMCQRLFLGSGLLLPFRDFHQDASFHYRSIHFDLDKIASGIVSGDLNLIREQLSGVFHVFQDQMLREYDYVDRLCMEFLFQLSHWTTNFQLNLDDFLSMQGIHYTDVGHCDTLESKREFLFEMLRLLSDKFASGKNSANNKLVYTIKKYIDENYLSNKISLEFIADKIHKNPAYVSKLFKSETGDNFSEYVTQKRMEKSQELLLDPTLKVYEIAEKTGYADVSNFIKVFRRYYGISPAEYRSRTGGIAEREEMQ